VSSLPFFWKSKNIKVKFYKYLPELEDECFYPIVLLMPFRLNCCAIVNIIFSGMTPHETHLPTEQDQATKSLWLPQKNVHSQRTQGHQPSPPSRAQTPDNCLKFPKAARVLYKGHFQRIMKAGTKVPCFHVLVHYRFHHAQRPRLGITVSKKHGKAHERNRFKRIVREAFRQCQHELPCGIELNIIPLSREKINTVSIVRDFLYFKERLRKRSTTSA